MTNQIIEGSLIFEFNDDIVKPHQNLHKLIKNRA